MTGLQVPADSEEIPCCSSHEGSGWLVAADSVGLIQRLQAEKISPLLTRRIAAVDRDLEIEYQEEKIRLNSEKNT